MSHLGCEYVLAYSVFKEKFGSIPLTAYTSMCMVCLPRELRGNTAHTKYSKGGLGMNRPL